MELFELCIEVWVRTAKGRGRGLQCVGSKGRYAKRVCVEPFVPTCPPAIIMHEHFLRCRIDDLCLQPLSSGVLYI
jgi:hypothetical protein